MGVTLNDGRRWLGNGFGYLTQWRAYDKDWNQVGLFANFSTSGSNGVLTFDGERHHFLNFKEWRTKVRSL